ncbi:ABC transporter substrate-binding protein [Leucobacter coleopterorum]|uniref:ABC transporter substrate-binding protein n=1 Tax=Leucobacter coleopterorum TaxID=2714933 RepID=A0ABX6JXI4_9MICO|nr:ABC transporter substrate-binding protein [Leucobacter coleopterorum]QIM18962.1 ABC transporter substrate-binding protein [Leucobacter coleopterorum]
MRFTKPGSITIAASAALTLALTGCTDASKEAANDAKTAETPKLPTETISKLDADPTLEALLPANIKTAGTLNVATDPTYAPFEVYAEDNKTVVGLDADLAESLGQLLGLKVTFVPSGFDNIIPGLTSGKYDMAMSAFSVTDERKQNADFVVYHQSGSGVAVPRGNPEKLSMDPMTLCGKTIGAEKGSTQGMEIMPDFTKQCEEAGKKPIDIKLFPGTDKAITALSSGRVEGVVSGATGLGYQAKITGAFDLAEGGDYEPKPTGLVLPKGSDLTPAITAAMEKLVTEKSYREAFQKWGINDSNEVTPAQVPVK